MTKYLYGASIQGIQSFIFQTNKLKEIVGGSALVEKVCTHYFEDFLKERNINYSEDAAIIQAAGNIKFEFQRREDCENVVLNFPRCVMNMAPGITVSQAVVEVEEGGSFTDGIQNLEDKLRIQRNKANYVSAQISSFMMAETARRTGGVGKYVNDEVIDYTQNAKIRENGNNRLYLALTGYKYVSDVEKIWELDDLVKDKSAEEELKPITSKNSNWIAVVHADGNNLGKKLIALYEASMPSEMLRTAIKAFSLTLDKATKEAAQEAFSDIIAPERKNGAKMPVRPILIGGDDLTVVIRGDLAVPFTNSFLKAFEKSTRRLFQNLEEELGLASYNLGWKEGLTACAGIAFIKPKYPFHYGVDMAEKLCKKAKKISKKCNAEYAPSSLFFHKVLSSFFDDMDEMVKNELTSKDGLRFDYGPYFLDSHEGYAQVDTLLEWAKLVRRPTAPRTNIREWLGVIRHDSVQAAYLMDRIREKLGANSKYLVSLDLNDPFERREGDMFTHLHDVISLSSI